MIGRRHLFGLMAAGVLAPAAFGHTTYNQWIVYRQKHLLIGSHRGDPPTYTHAQAVSDALEVFLPEARARPARAPFPGRLASLLATRQMDVCVVSTADAAAILAGDGDFAAYGAVPLELLADLDGYLLVAHADFPAHHGWLIASALREAKLSATEPTTDLPVHRGARAFMDGVPMQHVVEPT